MTDSLWKLECLICEFSNHDLVLMQEHLMADHGVRREELWKQTREPQGFDAAEYVFSLPDGLQWLKATRAVTTNME